MAGNMRSAHIGNYASNVSFRWRSKRQNTLMGFRGSVFRTRDFPNPLHTQVANFSLFTILALNRSFGRPPSSASKNSGPQPRIPSRPGEASPGGFRVESFLGSVRLFSSSPRILQMNELCRNSLNNWSTWYLLPSMRHTFVAVVKQPSQALGMSVRYARSMRRDPSELGVLLPSPSALVRLFSMIARVRL